MGFWERTWQERDDALKLAFGETEPPQTVVSFSWDFPHIPGACALAFPPIEGTRDPLRHRRDDWFYITMGLSQPLSKKQVEEERRGGKSYSARGFELCFIVPKESEWPSSALYSLLTQIIHGEEIAWGDRFPFWFSDGGAGKLDPYTGNPDHPQNAEKLTPWGDIRAVLFWPLLFPDAHFFTTTGKFLILVATGITEDEWNLARQTSTAHVLLLLCRAGIAQRTLPHRQSLLRQPQWAAQWQGISQLRPEECEAEIERGSGHWHLAPMHTG